MQYTYSYCVLIQMSRVNQPQTRLKATESTKTTNTLLTSLHKYLTHIAQYTRAHTRTLALRWVLMHTLLLNVKLTVNRDLRCIQTWLETHGVSLHARRDSSVQMCTQQTRSMAFNTWTEALQRSTQQPPQLTQRNKQTSHSLSHDAADDPRSVFVAGTLILLPGETSDQ